MAVAARPETLKPKGLQLDYTLAHAAATDAGCRSMRKANRKAWNRDDYDAACDELNRLLAYLDEPS